jgi:hypothetical protein
MDEVLKVKTGAPKDRKLTEIPETNAHRIKVNILWTGGFDSTFRIIQLSLLDVDIQPYYILEKRTSQGHELKAISEIIKVIEKRPKTKCNILPLIKFSKSGLEPDESVASAYKRLYARHTIGYQYEWLSRFSRHVPGIELCVEKSEMGYVSNCLRQNGKFIKISDRTVSYYIVDKENSSPDLVKLFGNFHFPHPLFDTTKLEMVELYKEWGFEQVMAMTWFCHTPINNKPCGLCTPCLAAMQEGLSYRLPPEGIKRYYNKQKYGHTRWFRLYMKIRLKLAKSFLI